MNYARVFRRIREVIDLLESNKITNHEALRAILRVITER